MTSPASVTMVGRAAELATLESALDDVLNGRPRGVLIGGEAGIGKTRLLREFAARADERATVLVGQCTDFGLAGSPLAPIRHIVRGLVAEFGPGALIAAAGTYAPALGLLHPDLRVGDADPDGDLLAEAIATALGVLSRERPLVVVIEDLQWADAATLALLRPLLHMLSEGRVLAILTYRSDDVGRGHPVRVVLAELERSRAVERIELRRLAAADTEALVQAIAGEGLEMRRIRELAARSDGVPFLVEELVGVAEAADDALPETLRDLVLARYERLSRPAQAIVRLIAVGGVAVDHDLLLAVHDGSVDELEAGIEEAVGENLIVPSATAYQFRHALTRDAVNEILLPGERVRVNSGYARALSEAPERAEVSARIAHHWLSAHDLVRAFAATLEAMADAERSYAVATAAELGERALELWPGIPDAGAVAGMDHVALMRRTAADLGDAGEPMRSLSLLEDAARHVDPRDVRLRAELLLDMAVQASSIEGMGLRPYLDEAIDLLEEGLGADTAQWVPDDQRLAARLIATQSVFRANHGHMQEALVLARRAQTHAAAADDLQQLLRARTYEARGLVGVGLEVEGFDAYASVARDALHVPAARARNAAFWGQDLALAGRYAEGAAMSDQGLAEARATGFDGIWGVDFLRSITEASIALGDWARADAALGAARRRRGEVDLGLIYMPLLDAQSRVAQGEVAGAIEELEPLRSRVGRARESDPELLPISVVTWVMIALAVGDLDAAAREVDPLLRPGRDLLPGHDDPALVIAAHVLGERRRAGLPVDTDAASSIRAQADRLRSRPNGGALLAVVDAEFAQTDAVGDWERAVEAVDEGSVPAYWRVEARAQLALASAEAGDRDSALEALARASAIASAVGAAGWSDRVDRVRAVVDPRAVRAGRPQSAGPELTAREREVLDLVVEGLTNPQIGARLFISAKTASVHVSAILRKIGVSSRTEAAVWAAEHRADA